MILPAFLFFLDKWLPSKIPMLVHDFFSKIQLNGYVHTFYFTRNKVFGQLLEERWIILLLY